MFSVSLDPNSEAGKSEAFVNDNYSTLQILYPGKWIVVYDSKVLFVSDSSEAMFQRAKALGMKRGDFYYRHVEPPLKVAAHIPNHLGI